MRSLLPSVPLTPLLLALEKALSIKSDNTTKVFGCWYLWKLLLCELVIDTLLDRAAVRAANY